MRSRPLSVLSGLLFATLAVPLGAQSPPTGVIETVAGSGCQSLNGAAASALFQVPSGVAVDKNGNVFVEDWTCILKINSAGQLTVVAGTGVADFLGDGGPATSAALDAISFPNGLAVDGSGNIFIADSSNNVVRQVTSATGVINTVAGNGTAGFVDNVPATSAELNLPLGVVVDSSGNYFIADANNCLVRRVDAISKIITTVAGTTAGAGTFSNCGFTGSTGPATSVQMSPIGIAVDSVGTVFIADQGDCVIWAVSGGNISVVAGTTNGAGTGANCNFSGDGGPAVSAQVAPSNVAVDAAGNLFIADLFNIREVFCADSAIPCTPPAGFSTGEIISVAGDGNNGFSGDGGLATSASLDLYAYGGVAVDGFGNLFIGDSFNFRIREVFCANSAIACTPPTGFNPGDITTRAGGGTGGDGGAATSATLDFPRSLAEDSSGNIFFGENDSRVRRIDAVTKTITTVAGNGIPGFSGDNGPATSAGVGILPASVTLDGSGNLFIADTNNQRIREVFCTNGAIQCAPPAGLSAGDITTVAGNGTGGFSGDGGLATNAELSLPSGVGCGGGVAVDGSGNLLIADTSNQRIREVFCTDGEIHCTPPAGLAAGDITTVAGNGTAGFSGDGGLATNAELNTPCAVVVDGSGNLFLADAGNARVRRVNVSTGIITTVAGNGILGLSGDGGLATSAAISLTPFESLAVDGSDNLFIAVQGYVGVSPTNRIRRVDAITGIITTVAGGGSPPDGLGDGLLATSADFTFHLSVAVDNSGHLLMADHADNRIREVQLFPAATLSSTTLSFAAQPVGVTSAPQSVTLTNNDAAALDVTGVMPSDPINFLEQDNCVGTLGGDSKCTIMVTFTPSNTGPFNATLTISDNAVNNPQLIQLTGTGAEFVLSSPASTTPINIASAGQSGTAPITVTAGNGFAGTVNLTCIVSPLNLTDPPTCSLKPTSATLTSATTTGQSTVTVNTTAGQIASLQPAGRPLGLDWLAKGADGIFLACAFLLAVPARNRRGATLLLTLLLLAFTAVGIGCGGGSSSTTTTGGTTVGPYTITVTGTSGNLVQTTTVLVNVQ
jgi:trimeric autotransporter adhesin